MNYKKTFDKPTCYKILETVKHDRMHLLYILIIFGTICVSITPSALAQHPGDGTKELIDDIKTSFKKANTFTPTDIHGPETPEQITCSKIAVTNEGHEGSIPYCVANATEVSISLQSLNAESSSLLINITSEGNGWISLKIPKNVWDLDDATNETAGEVPTLRVFVNGIEIVQKSTNPELIHLDNDANIAEIKNDDSSRTITIEFNNEAKEIMIVPEFGEIAMMILVITLISAIAISVKTKLQLIPR